VAAEMFRYDVTATGPAGFQVSLVHRVHGTHLIQDFRSLQAAESFAENMRKIDAGQFQSAHVRTEG